MGDRAFVMFKNHIKVSAMLYMHWDGQYANNMFVDYLKQWIESYPPDDYLITNPDYFLTLYTKIVIDNDETNRGMNGIRIINTPENIIKAIIDNSDDQLRILLNEFGCSVSDHGVLIIDIRDFNCLIFEV